MASAKPSIEAVQARHEAELMAKPEVEGVGIGEQGGVPCIIVYVSSPSNALPNNLPKDLEGYPVRVEHSGKFKASQ